MSTICGFEWETDSECDSQEDEDDHGCQGQHSCCLQSDHSDLEHECDCGDVAFDEERAAKLDAGNGIYQNNMKAMTRFITETLE